MGTPTTIPIRSSASRLLHEISLSGYPVVACSKPATIHDRERKLWEPKGFPRCRVATGQPLPRTLEIASKRSAYVLSDAATYLRLRRRLKLDLVLAQDAELHVAYRATLKKPRAQRLYDWLVSDSCKAQVKRFRIDHQRPFYLPREKPATPLRGRLDPPPPSRETEGR